MSSRENVLTWLAVGAGAVLVCFVGYAFVWSPLEDAWARDAEAKKALAQATSDLNEQNARNAQLLKLSPRLKVADKLSLPPSAPPQKTESSFRPIQDQKQAHMHHVGTLYESYLSRLLIGAEFDSVEVKARPAPTQTGGLKKQQAAPLFEQVVFNVTARGPQKAVYAALREFHKTNLLHIIRNLTVEVAKPKSREKVDPNVLTLTMTVEALALRGGEKRADLLPAELKEQPVVLASAERDYTLLKKRSIFTGLEKPYEPPPPKKKEEKKPPPPPEEDPPVSVSERLEVLENVKVTMVAYSQTNRRWEATLYDQAQGNGEEIKVAERGAFRSFTLYNGDEREVWECKVKFIGWPARAGDPDNAPTPEPELIFEADKKFYRAKVGDFLDAVYRKPLSDKEAIELGLKK